MPSPRRAELLLALAVLAAGCSRTHRQAPEVAGTADFALGTPVFLDAPLRVRFDAVVDAATLTADAVELVATDGPGVSVPARGTWRVAGTAVEFVPELAHAEPLRTGGGLQPGTRYELRVHASAGLRAVDGRPLAASTFAVVTRTGDSPAQLFGSNPPGGPRLVAAEVGPRDAAGDWQLGRAFAPSTMSLRFDQPLDPGLTNLPDSLQLRWNDPVYGAGTVAAVELSLEQNSIEGATVRLQPRGGCRRTR